MTRSEVHPKTQILVDALNAHFQKRTAGNGKEVPLFTTQPETAESVSTFDRVSSFSGPGGTLETSTPYYTRLFMVRPKLVTNNYGEVDNDDLEVVYLDLIEPANNGWKPMYDISTPESIDEFILVLDKEGDGTAVDRDAVSIAYRVKTDDE